MRAARRGIASANIGAVIHAIVVGTQALPRKNRLCIYLEMS